MQLLREQLSRKHFGPGQRHQVRWQSLQHLLCLHTFRRGFCSNLLLHLDVVSMEESWQLLARTAMSFCEGQDAIGLLHLISHGMLSSQLSDDATETSQDSIVRTIWAQRCLDAFPIRESLRSIVQGHVH
eukprot:Skav216079  [mRNA]  locus=scaffold3899:17258:26918:- [translate_table: standard]